MAAALSPPRDLVTYSPNPRKWKVWRDEPCLQEDGTIKGGNYFCEPKDIVLDPESSFVVHGDDSLFPSFPDISTKAHCELFSVIIHDDVDVNHLCGKFSLSGGFSYKKMDLFRRKKPEEDIAFFINEDGQKELVMAGPTVKSFRALDPVIFYMKFRNAVNNKSCHYDFALNGDSRRHSAYTYVYNTFFSATLSRKGVGSVTVNYAMYDNPVAAKVEIQLLHQDNTTTTNGHPVSGVIYAENAHHYKKTCLFYKNEETPCALVPDQDGNLIIPLSKSMVALPNMSKLIVHWDLKHSANTGLSSVKGDAVFSIPPVFSVPKTHKDLFMRIPDSQVVGNIIKVIVTWAVGFYK